jgi:predicted ester cyclase
MTKDEIKRIDAQGLAAWDKHDADAFVSLFANNFVWHDWTMPTPIRDKAGARQYFGGWMTAFPDMKTTLVSQVIGDDSVASEIAFSGTNTGPLMMGGKSLPPTHKKVVGRGSYMARLSGGKIVEYRTHPDVAGMMMQLGMMPGM